MLLAALRDLQWRRRRVATALVGTGLVFCMTLVLTGLSNGFAAEAEDTVESFGVETWLVREGATGPFLGASPIADVVVEEAARLPGVSAAAPMVYSRKGAGEGGDTDEVNIFGTTSDGPAMPTVSNGRSPEQPDEVAASSRLGYDVGDRIAVSGQRFRVVGEVDGSTALAGVPNVFMTVDGAQEVAFAGQPIVNAIALDGRPEQPLDGFTIMDVDDARADLLRPVEQARSAITVLAVLLWLVAATIVGSVIYLSALERVRDFAVYKATGMSTAAVAADLALQAVILAVLAAAVGAVLAALLGPRFPLPVKVPITAFALLPVLATLVGLVASLAGLRRAVTVDPALAFSGP